MSPVSLSIVQGSGLSPTFYIVMAYVRCNGCMLIDFSKAFDVFRHDVLGVQLAQLKLLLSILQWIISFQ